MIAEAQRTPGYSIRVVKNAPEHQVTTRISPLHRIASCSCGWQRQVRRGPNALGQSSKLRGLVNQHLRESK